MRRRRSLVGCRHASVACRLSLRVDNGVNSSSTGLVTLSRGGTVKLQGNVVHLIPGNQFMQPVHVYIVASGNQILQLGWNSPCDQPVGGAHCWWLHAGVWLLQPLVATAS